LDKQNRSKVSKTKNQASLLAESLQTLILLSIFYQDTLDKTQGAGSTKTVFRTLKTAGFP